MEILYRNTKIHFQSAGAGPALLLLHGFLENSSLWDKFIPSLSQNSQVITLDLLGHGLSQCHGYSHSMELMAETVVTVLDHLKIKSVTIAGHSMGGYIALALLEYLPERIKTIILINSSSIADSEERKKNRDRGIDLVKKNPKVYANMAISNLFAEKNREAFQKEIQILKTHAQQASLQGIIAAQEGMKIRSDRVTILKNFKGEKIIVAGKYDPILDFEMLKKEAEITNSQLISLNGAHMSPLENFCEVLDVLSL